MLLILAAMLSFMLIKLKLAQYFHCIICITEILNEGLVGL